MYKMCLYQHLSCLLCHALQGMDTYAHVQDAAIVKHMHVVDGQRAGPAEIKDVSTALVTCSTCQERL